MSRHLYCSARAFPRATGASPHWRNEIARSSRENQQRFAFKDDPQAARLAVAVLVGAACEVMIDPTRFDREHGENARGGQRGNEPENGTGRQKPPRHPC